MGYNSEKSQQNQIQWWATCWNFQARTVKQFCEICDMFKRKGQQSERRSRKKWKISKWDCQE